MNNKTSLKDLYSFPGFRALARLKSHPDHPGARVVTLQRRQKKRFVLAGLFIKAGMTAARRSFETWTPATRRSTSSLKSAVSNVPGAKP